MQSGADEQSANRFCLTRVWKMPNFQNRHLTSKCKSLIRLTSHHLGALWRSGDAADCKSPIESAHLPEKHYNFRSSCLPNKAGIWTVLACICLTISGPSEAYDKRIDGARWDPPARYAGTYEGRLILKEVPPANVKFECRKIGIRSKTNKPRGCASLSRDRKTCWVVTIDRPFYGTTPEAVLSHELGHCNSWPAHHPTE